MSSDTLVTRLETFSRIARKFPDFCYLGNPVLRTPAKTVSLEEGKKLGEKLGKILINYRKLVGYGRGLAANQIGISGSVFVTYFEDQIQVYINPKITKFSDSRNLYRELCLSSGIIWGDIKRSAGITLQWTDQDGKSRQEDFTGPEARIYQHETEHLNGVYSIDHAEPGTIGICLSDPLMEQLRPV